MHKSLTSYNIIIFLCKVEYTSITTSLHTHRFNPIQTQKLQLLITKEGKKSEVGPNIG